MRVMVSIIREPANDDRRSQVLAPIRCVALSTYDSHEPMPAIKIWDNIKEDNINYSEVASTLSRTDITPYGWNLRDDVWPCLTFNIIANGVSLPNKLQPLTEKWATVPLCDLSAIVGQGWRIPGIKLEHVVQRIFPEFNWEVCSEEMLAGEVEDISELHNKITLQHLILWKLLERYQDCMYGRKL